VQNFSDAAFELRHAATQVRELTTRFQSTQARTETFLATGDSVLSKMNRGQGTLGLLLNDPSLYHRADSLLVELRALSADIRANPKRYLSVRVF
jgi:phospholipid/cholesterol/gamma-HCH transport system substrate-binding protein